MSVLDDDICDIYSRKKHPGLAIKADYGGSRTAAIHLFCITCMGGSRSDAVSCQTKTCPLWQFRPGGKKGVISKALPTKEFLEGKISPEKRETGKKLAQGRIQED